MEVNDRLQHQYDGTTTILLDGRRVKLELW